MFLKKYRDSINSDASGREALINEKQPEYLHETVPFSARDFHRLRKIIAIQYVLIVSLFVFAIGAGIAGWSDPGLEIPDMVYSPAQDAIRYKNVVFNSGWGDQKSIYMGPPSEENNQAWDDLHVAPAMVKIPASDAAKLVNKTIPIPNASGYNSGYYLIGLDVFHQLHCLDMLRKVLWGVDMHDPNEEEAMHHLDHCIEMIRQSLTCSADITVDVWAWNEQKQMVTVRADNMHTCRDFEAIRQWALERPAGEFDRTIHMMAS
ncbi:hypothetical protein KXX25_004683 [Aspergillus fumigatus]|nr:hypothetical protein KXX29_005493 [Aspergillus fumigatus]KMK56339.1 hypothetical protein Y699_09205 [Aspergillus fumigatus Z5]KAH1629867.1 hypothetical protein KXX39_003318 [Aspergillus fumigatus]KAH1713720.1 hypothetical protein KXX40_004776 [Aspergillus fumigatus]KAH1716482.1 hypothetical protein KXX25_004683 [Aspergillus fumigatus]